MDQGSGDATEVDTGAPNDFSERLVDGFFRRWMLYLVPVAIFAAIGVYTAGNITAGYQSFAQLSAASNPFLTQPTVRGTEIGLYETPADGTARLINEQLQTDAFIDVVAAQAGLTDAITANVITRADLRDRVGAGAAGQNNLRVSARWSDPDTAYRLVDGTIKGYTEYIAGIAAADSLQAVEFWTEQKAAATEEVRLAQDEITTYVNGLPLLPDRTDRPTEQVLEIQRLNTGLDRALETERDAQDAIDEAQLTAKQAASNSTRGLTVIDAPEITDAPESVRRDKVIAIAMFSLFGLLIAIAALVLSTVADRSIRTRAQLGYATSVASVVTIPRIKQLKRAKRAKRPSVPAPDTAA